jgi:polar amino acid transport system substrate-binding protein
LSVFASNTNAELQMIDVICDEWPPYQIIENNHISGFSTKIVETVFERMKIDVKSIKAYPWKRAITMIENGKTDALFSANYTKERAKFAFYPEEMLVLSPWVMWVREEDNLKYESFDDLLGKKVGLVRGYSYTPEFWNFVKKHKIYEEVANDEQNFKKLNGGRVDFILAEFGNGLFIVKYLGLNKIIPLRNNPVKSDGLYIIFNKKNVTKSFVDKFSDELKKLKQESLYEYLYQEYFKLELR